MKRKIAALALTAAVLLTIGGCRDSASMPPASEENLTQQTSRFPRNSPESANSSAAERPEVTGKKPGEEPGEKPAELHGPYPVERVVDGDTLIVHIDGTRTRLRLIGVDTPESVAGDTERNTPYGAIASDYVKELLEDTQIYLEYDLEREDSYGRTLAYVYLEDRVTMLERLLLENGHAEAIRVKPNDRYYNEFAALEEQARQAGIGMWSGSETAGGKAAQ
jgi:micrococcal nuclease